MDPNVVKIVQDFDGNALYFSRAPVPWVRDTGAKVAAQHCKHIGVYGYRRDALLEFPTLPPGELERIEQLEQLRWLENGFRIRVVETEYDAISVDVPADVERVEKLLKTQSKTEQLRSSPQAAASSSESSGCCGAKDKSQNLKSWFDSHCAFLSIMFCTQILQEEVEGPCGPPQNTFL